MNPRERLLATLNRQPVDRTPVDLWYTPEIYSLLCRHAGVAEGDNLALFRTLKLDKIVWVNPAYTGSLRPVEPGRVATHWGSILRVQQAGEAIYNEAETPALVHCESAAEVEAFPWWPDPRQFDIDGAIATVDEFGTEYVTLGPWISFFEIYCQMRGLENAMMDLIADPDMVRVALDRIEQIQTEMLHALYGTLKARGINQIDLAFISDDMGSQENLLISLKHWDLHLRDRMTRWCDLIHSYGIKVFFHSDGACEPLLPRLIDCGIDVLNPIQHVCPGMDCAELKAKYGDKVIFHGGIENQKIIPFGTAAEVRDEVRHCLQTLGLAGGYVVCSCHNIQPGTPLENILALIDTVHQAG